MTPTHRRADAGHTYGHLHLEVISIEFERKVRESPLEKPRWAQNQDELEVCWEGRLQDNRRAVGRCAAECRVLKSLLLTARSGRGGHHTGTEVAADTRLCRDSPLLKRKGEGHTAAANTGRALSTVRSKALFQAERCPCKFTHQAQTPVTQDVTFWKQGLYRADQVCVRSLLWPQSQYSWSLWKGVTWARTHRRCRVKTGDTSTSLGAPEIARTLQNLGEGQLLPRGPRTNLPAPSLWTSGSRL